MTDPDLKPRTVGELLDAAFFVYRRRFPRLVLVAILVSVPTVAVAAIFAGDAAGAVREFTSVMQDAARSNPNDPWAMLERMFGAYRNIAPTLTLEMLLQAFARASVSLAMAPVILAAVRRAPHPSLGAIARVTAARILPALVLQLLFDLCWGGLWCCCPPIGLFVGVLLAPTAAALALERGPLESSLRASLPAPVAAALAPFAAFFDALVRGAQLSWNGRIVARGVLCFGALLTLVSIFDSAVVLPFADAADGSGHWFWIQHCAEMVFLPVVGLARALWYFDLVVRREGVDLEPAA